MKQALWVFLLIETTHVFKQTRGTILKHSRSDKCIAFLQDNRCNSITLAIKGHIKEPTSGARNNCIGYLDSIKPNRNSIHDLGLPDTNLLKCEWMPEVGLLSHPKGIDGLAVLRLVFMNAVLQCLEFSAFSSPWKTYVPNATIQFSVNTIN